MNFQTRHIQKTVLEQELLAFSSRRRSTALREISLLTNVLATRKLVNHHLGLGSARMKDGNNNRVPCG